MEKDIQYIFIFSFIVLTFFTILCKYLVKKGAKSGPELLGRTYTFWGLFFLLLIVALTPKFITFIFIGAVAVMSLYEYFLFNKNASPHKSIAFWTIVMAMPIELFFFYQDNATLALCLPILISLFLFPIFYIWQNSPHQIIEKFGHHSSATIFFLFGVCSGAALVNYGAIVLLYCIVLTEMRDLLSYWMGKFFSKIASKNKSSFLFQVLNYKIADKVSPNKTWAVGILTTLVLASSALFFQGIIPGYSQNNIILWIILIGFFGLMGDLAFSLFKREFGLKDSGSLLPGSTGFIDRIDSLIFTFPITYLYFYFLK
jgi:phosphatidate cytidylyltransferase